MKKFFELGNRYAKKSTWVDFALVKFCLCAMGVIIGLQIPKKHKKEATEIAGSVFIVTYLPLMAKVLTTVKEMLK
ncbi:MAG: permease of phosphate ABC transporter [Eubacteriales bacterium]|nr:permease of phosphate ABC transporter [Eubacteriales bacterium]